MIGRIVNDLDVLFVAVAFSVVGGGGGGEQMPPVCSRFSQQRLIQGSLVFGPRIWRL